MAYDEALPGEDQSIETERKTVAGEEQEAETENCEQIPGDSETPTLSKTAQKKIAKKLAKQVRWEAKKAEKKAKEKELKCKAKDKKILEWKEKLSSVSEADKLELIESRRSIKKERVDRQLEEKEKKIQRLNNGKLHGQNVVIDFQFADLMEPKEINSLSQQVMYCYAVNSRCALPAHLWLTGCTGDIDAKMSSLPGFDKWIVEKHKTSYMETFEDRKDKLVYLTADTETVLDDLDLNDIYIIGGLVDRNRWKGITFKKAQEQGIRTAKLPIGNFLKMSSSQVLTVNQVVEILLKYLETKDWKTSFFEVIPQRKRSVSGTEENGREGENEESKTVNESCDSQKKIKLSFEENDEASKDKAATKINISSDENGTAPKENQLQNNVEEKADEP